MLRPAVILVRPQEEGNVGAVARAMANMGLERLILVEPAPVLAGVARGFGVGGWEILDRAVRVPTFEAAIAPFGRLVATTSLRQRPLRRRRVISARRLPEVLAADPEGTETALVFGSESTGLEGRELELCSPVVAIPTAPRHPTLNLAQAVLIVAYELHMFGATLPEESSAVGESPDAAGPLASAEQVDELRRAVDELLLDIGFDHPPIRAGLLRDVLRLVVRASPSDREIRILRRLGNRASRALARSSDAE
ncbi:MAG: TrmH family RNA methyltransferase [Acidobacteriota bacterium]